MDTSVATNPEFWRVVGVPGAIAIILILSVIKLLHWFMKQFLKQHAEQGKQFVEEMKGIGGKVDRNLERVETMNAEHRQAMRDMADEHRRTIEMVMAKAR